MRRLIEVCLIAAILVLLAWLAAGCEYDIPEDSNDSEGITIIAQNWGYEKGNIDANAEGITIISLGRFYDTNAERDAALIELIKKQEGNDFITIPRDVNNVNIRFVSGD